MVMKGEWYVDSIGDFWYIIREGYKQQKKIGKKWINGGKGTTQKKKIGKMAMRGTNYYDKACTEAEKRNSQKNER